MVKIMNMEMKNFKRSFLFHKYTTEICFIGNYDESHFRDVIITGI